MTKIAIAGAGIAGLTAAICLARKGMECDVYEAAPELAEIGAGLQLSPNASRLLDRIGLLAPVQAAWNEPERIALLSGMTLTPLAHVPAGEAAQARWNGRYGVLHRASLQKALVDAIGQNSGITLHLGKPVTPDMFQGSDYPLVVGADGVWSSMRAAIPGAPASRFSGHVAWRFMIGRDQAPDWLRVDQVSAFLGPSCHLVVYPLDEHGALNAIAIVSGRSNTQNWAEPADRSHRQMLSGAFSRWDRRIRALIEDCADPTFWPLHETGHGAWHNGSDRVLIGDAAHAMTPFAAQGAAMAIEDGYVLAGVLAGTLARSGDMGQALAAFEALRKPRIEKVKRRGAFNGFAYHARGPVRAVRDLVLSFSSPQSLASGMDWLYGFDPD